MWVLVCTTCAILYFAIVWLWNFLVKKDDHYLRRKRVLEMSNHDPSLTSEQKVHRMHSASVFCFKLSFGETSHCPINHVDYRTMCVKQTAVGGQPLVDLLLCASESVCAVLWTFLFVWYDTIITFRGFPEPDHLKPLSRALEPVWRLLTRPRRLPTSPTHQMFGFPFVPPLYWSGLAQRRRSSWSKTLSSFKPLRFWKNCYRKSLNLEARKVDWTSQRQANIGQKSLQKQFTWIPSVHRKRRVVCHRRRRNNLSTSPGQWQSCQLTSWDKVMGYWDRVMGYWDRVMGYWDKVMGYWDRVMGYWDRVMGYRDRVMGYWDKVMGYWDRVMGYWDRVMGYWDKVMGYWDRVMGYWDKVMGYWDRVMGYWDRVMGYWDRVCSNPGYWDRVMGYWDRVCSNPGYWDRVMGYWDRVMGYWDRVLSNPEQYSTLKSYFSKRSCRELSLAHLSPLMTLDKLPPLYFKLAQPVEQNAALLVTNCKHNN